MRTKVRMRDRRDLLIILRPSFWRARFLDWGVLAMFSLSVGVGIGSSPGV